MSFQKEWAKGLEIRVFEGKFGPLALFEDEGVRKFGTGYVTEQQVLSHCTPIHMTYS